MIPGIPSMGGAELLIILAIIMLFFGAKRVPQLSRALGQSLREFRQGAAAEDGKDEAKQLPEEDGKKPSLNGSAARNEAVRTEVKAPHAQQDL
jgi:sec-independent protein translocase protein TatA